MKTKTMKYLMLMLALGLGGCTSVYEGGHKVLCTGANMDQMAFRTPAGTTLTAARIDHSSIHRAAGDTVSKTGVAVATSGVFGFLRGLF